MALTTPKMGLRVWDQLNDPYDHNQMADNWSKVDFHDHTPGRGVQIPTEGIADGAITAAKLVATLDPTPVYATYKTVRFGHLTIGAGSSPGNFAAAPQGPNNASYTAAGSTAYLFRIDPADFAAGSRSVVFRLVGALLVTSGTAPTGNFTPSLWKVSTISGTTPSLAGTTWTGTAVSAPSGNSMTAFASADIAGVTAGFYAFGINTSATIAVGSSIAADVQLQVRQV